MKAYPTLRFKLWEQTPQNILDEVGGEILTCSCLQNLDSIQLDPSPLSTYDLNCVFLTNSQIHEIIFAVTGFINDGFQHALKGSEMPLQFCFACASVYLSLLGKMFLPGQFCLECCAAWSSVHDLCQVAASWEHLTYHTYCCADIQAKTNPLDVNGILISRSRVRIITKVMA